MVIYMYDFLKLYTIFSFNSKLLTCSIYSFYNLVYLIESNNRFSNST